MRSLISTVLAASAALIGCKPDSADSGQELRTALGHRESRPVQVKTPSTDDVEHPPLVAVDKVDLDRYMGQWHEIARYPSVFQKNIVGVIAEYRLRKDGRIDVINSGFVGSLRGKRDRAESVGWVSDENSNAKWKVQFIWPFTVSYWIIDLGDNYEYAVVGQPSRKYLWVLSRTPQMDDETYKRLSKQEYDSARLQKTPQPEDPD